MVKRARAGDREAFGLLIERHQRAVAGLLTGILRDMDSAEDAAQQAFVKAFRGLRSFQNRSSFKTWVTRIALNEARSRMRRDRLALRGPAPRPGEDGGAWEERVRATRLDAAERDALERRIELDRAMAGLSPREHEITAMRLEGYTLEEIAGALDVSRGTVKSTLFDATRKMKRILT